MKSKAIRNGLSRRGLLAGGGAALLLLAVGPRPAAAQSLNDLLAQGKLGERWDGLVQARDAAFQAQANRINQERLRIYDQRAKQNNQTVQVVGQIYAREIYDRAAKGTWFLTQAGNWVQK